MRLFVDFFLHPILVSDIKKSHSWLVTTSHEQHVCVYVSLQHNVNRETWMILTYCVIWCNTTWITPLITGEGRLPLFPPPLPLSLALCLTCSHYRLPEPPLPILHIYSMHSCHMAGRREQIKRLIREHLGKYSIF